MRDPEGRRWPAPPDPGATRRRVLLFGLSVVLVLVGLVAASLAVAAFITALPEKKEPATDAARSLPFDPPRGMPRIGSYVESRVLPSTDIEVRQWIRSRTPLTTIMLAAPRVQAGAEPRAIEVVVAADSRVVSTGGALDGAAKQFVFDHPARQVYLSYRLVDAVDLSPSVDGRALARVTSLDVDYGPGQGPTRVAVRADEVLSMACTDPTSQGETPRPCGTPGDKSWTVTLSGARENDLVMAQLDLG